MEFDAANLNATLTGVLTSSISRELSYRLEEALEVTDGLWELAPIVLAAGEQQDQQDPAEMADKSPAGRRVPAERRASVRAVADAIDSMQEEALAGGQISEAELSELSMAEVIADPFGLLGRMMDIRKQAALGLSAMELASSLSPDELLYLRTYIRATRKAARTPVLLRALFIAAIATIEPLVTRLVQLLLFHANPDAYGSLVSSQLDVDARRLCFGGPVKWRESLVERLGVARLAQAIDWTRLGTLWEDRNVLAHRAGVVDSRHNSVTGSQPGSIISPDVDAVRSALDLIGPTRFALVACVWAHLEPNIGSRAGDPGWPAFCDSLREGRWEQAAGLARVEEALAAGPQAQATARVNRWLAVDAGHGPEPIRAEVEAWDTSGLSPDFELARQVLLRNDEHAIVMTHGLLADGVISQADVDSWPLFDRLRSTGALSR